MENFKIVETGSKYPDVLLYRERDGDGNEYVKILSIGIIDGTDDIFCGEECNFEHPDLAKSFITDFSVKSAEEFCKRHKVMY
jgi:hypothetical protein